MHGFNSIDLTEDSHDHKHWCSGVLKDKGKLDDQVVVSDFNSVTWPDNTELSLIDSGSF